MLTTADKPVSDGKGICTVHEGAPCTPVFLEWVGVSSDIICCGHHALLANSAIPCAGGGIAHIKPQNINVYTSTPKNVNDSEFKYLSENSDTDSISRNNNAYPSESAENNVSEEYTTNPDILRKQKWCMGRCPAEFKDYCRFCTESENEMNHKNNSSALSDNMKNADNKAFSDVTGLIRSICFQSDCSIINASDAKHHIIPGNACFRKCPLLVKLGNLFDYDINSAVNGIILPTFSNISAWNGRKSELYTFAMKKACELVEKADSAGQIMGTQLHLGPHRFDKQLSVLNPVIQLDTTDYKQKMKMLVRIVGKIYPAVKTFRSYEKLILTDYLQPLEYQYMKRYEKTCYMRDYEKEKINFHEKMNYISSEIRRKIKQFPYHEKFFDMLSHRTYVSFAALLYDLNISAEDWEQIIKQEE